MKKAAERITRRSGIIRGRNHAILSTRRRRKRRSRMRVILLQKLEFPKKEKDRRPPEEHKVKARPIEMQAQS